MKKEHKRPQHQSVALRVWLGILFCCWVASLEAQSPTLLGHWKLAGDARDSSENQRHLTEHQIKWQPADLIGIADIAATLNGRDSFLEVPSASAPSLGTNNFTVNLWFHTDEALDDVIGD